MTENVAREPLINHRYRILRRLGAGAMGTVHLVADTLDDNQPVALKTIRKGFNSSSEHSAFKSEFQAMTTFHHPNVVEVYEFGTLAGTEADFFTMEFVDGQNLLQACREAELDTVYDYAAQIGRALEYIHAQGFIHFDLKPDNIMVHRDGTVKVMDFGLVEQGSFRQARVLKGTINYLAPEMVRGGRVDARLDLYSLGALLFHVLTGRPLFQGSVEQVLDQHVSAEPDLESNVQRPVPEALRPLLCRLLAKQPEQRPGSAGEFLLELERITGGAHGVRVLELSRNYALGSRSVGREAQLGRLKEQLRGRVLEQQATGPALLVASGASGSGKSRLMRELRHHVQVRRVRFYQGSCLQNDGQPYLPFVEILRTLVRDILPDSAVPDLRQGGAPGEDSTYSGSSIDSLVGSRVDDVTRGSSSRVGASVLPRRTEHTTGEAPLEATVLRASTGEAPLEATVVGRTGLESLAEGESSAAEQEDAEESPTEDELLLRRKLEAVLREHAAALCRVVRDEQGLSELALEAPRFSQPEREKAWLQASLCGFLLAVSRLQPLVLYCADLQWADPLSVELLGQLTRALARAGQEGGETARLLLCGCYRPDEALPPLHRALEELCAEGAAERVELPPLSAVDVRAMLGSMLGRVEEEEKVAAVLAERTGGNPFFIEASMRQMLGDGSLTRQGTTWRFAPRALRETAHASTLGEVLDRMLAQVPRAERELLELLSVFNRPVSLALLSAADGGQQKALRELLASLRQRRFVARGWADGRNHYSLRHNTLREHLYRVLEPERRLRLHQAAGHALESFHGQGERYLEDLAWHFRCAGHLDKALLYTRRAADQARHLYDLKRAAALYQQAYEAVRLLSADLAVNIAESSLYIPSEKHVERLQAALPVVEELQDTERLARIRNWMGRTYYALGRQRDAIQWFTRFMETRVGDQDDTSRALPHAVLGRVSFFLGRFDAARTHLEKSVELLEGHVGAEEDISYALGMCGSSYAYLGPLEHGLKLVDRSIALAEEINHATRRALGRIYRGIILAHHGRWAEARQWLDMGLELARETGDVVGVGTGSSFRGLVSLAEGDPAAAAEQCRFGRAHIARSGGTMTFTMMGSHLAEALLAAGDVEGAAAVVRETLPVLETGERWGESCLRLVEGRIEEALGEHAQARACFEQALSVAQQQQGRPFEAKARLALGVWMRDRGQPGAQGQLEHARSLFSSLGMTWYRERAEAALAGQPLGICP